MGEAQTRAAIQAIDEQIKEICEDMSHNQED